MYTKSHTLYFCRNFVKFFQFMLQYSEVEKTMDFSSINCLILDPGPASHMCTLHTNNLQQKEFARTHKEDKNVYIFHILYVVVVQVVIFIS